MGVMHKTNGKSYSALFSRSPRMRAISKLIENIADTDLMVSCALEPRRGRADSPRQLQNAAP